MDARIERLTYLPLPTPSSPSGGGQERSFYLPRGDQEAAEGQKPEPGSEDDHVLAPMPPRAEKPVSRQRLSDELGHRIDVRG